MNLLDRYVIRQFAFYFLLILTALTAVYLLVDIFERLDKFQAKNISTALTAQYFIIKIPLICDQIAPVCLLLAGVVTLGLLINHHELLTLHSAGVSNFLVLRPFWIGAILMTIFTLATAQWLVPPAYRETNRIWQEEVLGRKDLGIIRDGTTFYRGSKGIYTFSVDRKKEYLLRNFRYLAQDEKGQQEMLLYAHRAEWYGDAWHFFRGQVKKINGDAPYTIKPFTELSMALPENAPDFFAPRPEATELELISLVSRALHAKKPDKRQAVLDAHRRFSYLFLGLPLLILALPLLFRFRNGQGTVNLAIAIPASAGLAFGAWGIWGGLQAMAQASMLMPLTASWSIHLVCIALGGLLRKWLA